MRTRIIVRRLAIIVCALVVVLALTHLCATAAARAELRAARAELAASGAPLAITDVRPPVPPEDDAAEAWYRALSLIYDGAIGPQAFAPRGPSVSEMRLRPEFRAGESGGLPERSDPAGWTAAEHTAVIAACDTHAELWNAIADATNRPHCRFPIRYWDGLSCRTPDVIWFRRAMSLMRLRVVLAAERGDGAEACSWAVRLLRMADHVDEDALTISHLVSDSIRAAAVAAIAPRISTIGEDEALRRLAAAVGAIDLSRRMTDAVDGERITFGEPLTFHGSLVSLVADRYNSVGWRIYASALGEPLRLHDQACYWRAMLSARNGNDPSKPLLGPITSDMVAGIPVQHRLTERHTRRLDLLIAAIAAQRFRLATGAWPIALEQVAPYLARAPRPTSGVRLVLESGGLALRAEPLDDEVSPVIRAKQERDLTIVLAR